MQSSLNQKQLLHTREIDEFNKTVAQTEKNIKEQIGPNNSYPKIIFVGITGSGKTTISCSLAKIKIFISEGKGRRAQINGPGIEPGCQSATKEPTIMSDKNSGLIYIDCPGFEDTKGFDQEIINSFVLNSIFEKKENQTNRFKILLVSQESEFDAGRATAILKSITRLKEMFKDIDQIEKGIGLVITRSEIGVTGINYIERLEENPPPLMKRWCDFFKAHPDRIFLLPRARLDQIGQEYTFEDHQKLENFVTKDFIVDPITNITLNETSLLQMKYIREVHMQNVSEKIGELCKKITTQFRKSQTSNEIGKWIDIMHEMIKVKNVKKAKDFESVIKNHIPNAEQYKDDFIGLAEFEVFDAFIDKFLNPNDNSSCLNDVIRGWAYQSVDELHKSQSEAKESEFQKKILSEQQQKIEEQNQISKEQKQKLIEMQQLFESEIENNKRFQEQIKQLNIIIKNQSNEINNLKNSGSRRICLLI